MPIYKEIGKTTYEFNSNRSITVSHDPASAKDSNISPIKAIIGNKVVYIHANESNLATNTSATAVRSSGKAAYGAYMDDLVGDVIYGMHSSASLFGSALMKSVCAVDGKHMVGSRACFYTYIVDSGYKDKGYSATVPAWYVPACTVRIMKYSVNTNDIDITALPVPKQSVPERSYGASNQYNYAASCVELSVNKSENDVVLGISFEYEKHNIQMVGSPYGIQYSLDDGVNFYDLPAGHKFENVEHVIFRNNGDVVVGFSSDGVNPDMAALVKGAEKIIVPEEDMTIHLIGGVG